MLKEATTVELPLLHAGVKKTTILILCCVLILSILFESFQQQYYLIKFNLAENVAFLDLLRNQSYRWFIWSIFGLVLYVYALRMKDHPIGGTIARYFALILVLVALNIVIISLIEYFPATAFSLRDFVVDYVVFFSFQKGPVYVLGYISVATVLHLYIENTRLSISIKNLKDIETVDRKLYSTLKDSNNDQEKILTVKVGSKYKAVAIKSISYIEADDYCVKIYEDDDKVYVMRISLKALEKILPDYFERVHRKFIVNMNSIVEFDAANRQVTMANSRSLSISKNNVSRVKSQFVNGQLGT